MKSILTILLVSIVYIGLAQQMPPERRAELENYKIAYLTRELDLSPDQAEKFWPLYNEFNEDRGDLRIERGKLRMDINKSSIDESEARRILKQDNELKVREAALEKEYYDKLLNVLPAPKVIALVKAEMNFNREILNRLRRQRMRPDNRNGGQR